MHSMHFLPPKQTLLILIRLIWVYILLPLGKSEYGKADDSCNKCRKNQTTVEPVLSDYSKIDKTDHSKIDKTKVLKTDGNLMKVHLH